MPLTDDELSVAYRELTGSNVGQRACPASDVLARAAAGELEPAERDAVVAHVEECPTCADDFRIACGLLSGITTAQGSGGAATAVGRSFIPYALAASLAIVTTGLLAWNVSLRQRTADLGARLDQALRTAEQSQNVPASAPAPPELQAHVNVPVIDLVPPSPVRGEVTRRQVIRVPRGTALVTLIVNTHTERRANDFTLDLVDAGGQAIWTGTGLRPGPDGILSVALPAQLLRSGDHVFSLTETTSRRLVHRYPVTIVSP